MLTKHGPKIFTLDEANALLPELDNRLSRLLSKTEDYHSTHDTLFFHELIHATEQQGGFASKEFSGPDDDFWRLENKLEEIQHDIDEISRMGVILRDLETGKVDFLGKNGETWVCFCWHRGEEKISHYHPVGDTEDKRIRLA